ncbi:MAG TPA: hypothetical protein VMJ11_22820 [Paraburkholderia sp.]|uniref:hypothetical protein n=1 Tax=Paraburkholderia sp. TaxID=1926495 RepID=UPI002B9EA2CF|nr:hypothetical protein [Paraburkholderia sp.]HTR09430.1 hypothetical protein [Paraburkholderia sp.]
MKRRAWIACTALCAAGCASAPDLQSGWYLQRPAEVRQAAQSPASAATPGDDANPLELYVAVLNRGTVSHKLRCVVVNRTDATGSWVYSADNESLEPGQLRVIAEKQFKHAAGAPASAQACPAPDGDEGTMLSRCVVPVSVNVVVDEFVTVRSDFASALPSMLPENWQTCPKPLPPSTE